MSLELGFSKVGFSLNRAFVLRQDFIDMTDGMTTMHSESLIETCLEPISFLSTVRNRHTAMQ